MHSPRLCGKPIAAKAFLFPSAQVDFADIVDNMSPRLRGFSLLSLLSFFSFISLISFRSLPRTPSTSASSTPTSRTRYSA